MKFFLLLILPAITSAFAEVKLPHIFSDGMVLQQEGASKVWGWSDADSGVKVSFAGQILETKTGRDGMWVVTFKGLKANSSGQNLTVQSGSHTHIIKDVLIGEVWLASGQSNMEWRVQHTNGGKEEIAAATDPLLRVFVSRNVGSRAPQKNWLGSWKDTRPAHTASFTAVGYYFAKRLRAELGVPVGVIECAWGGRPVEAFTSVEALKALPEAKGLLDRKAKAVAEWDPKKAKAWFKKKKAEYDAKFAEWKKTKKGKRPRGPRKPVDPSEDSKYASTIYNGMIAPIVGYGTRGAIWYQGESNANHSSAKEYQELLGCLVADWRKRWGSEMSFYWVQLANFQKPTDCPGVEDDWVTVQDEMRRALKTIPKSGMAVINDIGQANDIHPRNKLDVGERLARWALAKDYGKKGIVLTGPLYSGSEIKDGKVMISFDHAVGLKSSDGKILQRFEIAGADGKWHWGQAEIKDGKVIVSSVKVPAPTKARYAWARNPSGANLVNAEGLPASCFTTE